VKIRTKTLKTGREYRCRLPLSRRSDRMAEKKFGTRCKHGRQQNGQKVGCRGCEPRTHRVRD